MRIWSFFALLLFVSLLVAIFVDPVAQVKGDKKEVALVEFNNYQVYEIKDEGVKDLLVAYKGRHYKEYEELEHPIYLKEREGVYSFVGANMATIKGDLITMVKDVFYTDSDGYQLLAQKAIYDRSNARLSGSGGFVATNLDNRFIGDNFLVRIDTKKLEAYNIKAFYTVKE